MEAHEVLDKQFNKIMELIDTLLEDIAGEPIGFTLIAFHDHHAIYGSNCDRGEIVVQLELLLEHWKAAKPNPDVMYN